jgi:hypothetical protein
MMAPPSLQILTLDHLDRNGLEFEIVEEPDDFVKNIPIRRDGSRRMSPPISTGQATPRRWQ